MDAVLNGPNGPTHLGSNVTMLGRTPDNQVVVNDVKSSSHHAEIRLAGQSYTLTDLGSTNGTFVNGQPLDRNMPRALLSGDTIRIGDTTYMFELRNVQQAGLGVYSNPGPVSNPGFAPTQVAPQYPGTAYGGNPGIADAPNAPYYPPVQPAANYQQPYPPQQNNIPPPGGSSFNQYNQPTAYNAPPPPPQYNVAPQYNPASLPGTYPLGGGVPPYTPPTPPKKSGTIRTVVLVLLALIVVLGAIGTFVVHNNQVAVDNTNATATAQTNVAHTKATTVALAGATATAVLNATATAGAQDTINDGPYATGTVALADPLKDNSGGYQWQEDTHCSFTQGVYEVKESSQNTFNSCFAKNTSFSNFSYRVALTILKGDCAGIVFRGDATSSKQYYYEICQTGAYDVVVFDGSGNTGKYVIKPIINSAIKMGSAINVIAVTANNDTLQVYANSTLLNTIQDTALTSGSIGVVVINNKSAGTDAGFAGAKVWKI